MRTPSFAADALICSNGYTGALNKAMAAAPGHMKLETVRAILDKAEKLQEAADLDIDDTYALRCAVKEGSESLVYCILAARMERTGSFQGHQGDNLGAMLLLAAERDRFAVVCLLLGRPVMTSMRLGPLVRADFSDHAVLMAAVEAGSGSIVRALISTTLEFAAKPNAREGAALLKACECGYLDIARQLVRQDHPFAALRDFITDLGGSPLVSASSSGCVGLVRLLLDRSFQHAARADCNHGRALEGAAANGHEEVISVLLNCPHDAPTPGTNNNAALFAAIQGGHFGAAR